MKPEWPQVVHAAHGTVEAHARWCPVDMARVALTGSSLGNAKFQGLGISCECRQKKPPPSAMGRPVE